MGNRFEVHCWGKCSFHGACYVDNPVYLGEHLIPALWAAWRAKRRGVGCVRLEWR